jgi:hypothetical protein
LVSDIKEEHRLGAFESRMPRRVFGPKRDEIIGCWEKIHNEKLYNLYSLPNIIRIRSRRMRFEGHVACMEEKKNNAHRVLAAKPE